MRIQFEPSVPVTFMGNTIYMAKEDFLFAQRVRRDAIKEFKYNAMRWVDGEPVRSGYYTIQRPTELMPGGELCPTFVVTRFESRDIRRMGLERELIYDLWRAPGTGEKLENFPA